MTLELVRLSGNSDDPTPYLPLKRNVLANGVKKGDGRGLNLGADAIGSVAEEPTVGTVLPDMTDTSEILCGARTWKSEQPGPPPSLKADRTA